MEFVLFGFRTAFDTMSPLDPYQIPFEITTRPLVDLYWIPTRSLLDPY